MQMDHAVGVSPVHVHRTVDREAGGVHGVRRRLDLVSVHIYLDQARGGHLLEELPVGVDQEVVAVGHPSGEMGEDQVVPAVERHEPIRGGEIGADGALLGRAKDWGSKLQRS